MSAPPDTDDMLPLVADFRRRLGIFGRLLRTPRAEALRAIQDRGDRPAATNGLRAE